MVATTHHYREIGRAEGLTPNRYRELVGKTPAIRKVLAELVIDTELAAAIEAGQPSALELAFELINLGAPVDARVSDFSRTAYHRMHPDLARARVEPLHHYLHHGAREGRRILRELRAGQHAGKLPYRPERPTCLIAVHECSRTGAPIVGLELAREAARTHNVIVSALRDGPLLSEFRETACQVVITGAPLQDFEYYSEEVFQKIDFAILNSVVTFPFITMLVAKEIPFAGYIHEYTEYTFPASRFSPFPMLADLLVFSSDHVRRSWQGRMADFDFDIERDSTIIPQRPFHLGGVCPDEQAQARARLSQVIGRDLTDTKIICGAGHSQWRKGTDIFAMAAQICRGRDPDTVFIWIGDGMIADELQFGVYMTHHLKEIGAGLAGSNLFFIPAGTAYPDVLAASDAMFLSSRLDPLPNVVFDALEHGCRIVQFEGASGFGDEIYRRSDRFVTVEYANPEAAVTAILALPKKPASAEIPRKPEFHLFDRIRRSLKDRLSRQRYFVRGASMIEVPVVFDGEPDGSPLRVREREKMQRYRRRYVWRDLEEVEDALETSDNWVHRKLRLAPYGVAQEASIPPFSMHVHVFYTDDLAADLARFAIFGRAERIVVTTDTAEKADRIDRIMAGAGLAADVVLVPNRGRDILPFMELFNEGGAAGNDEIWCHLHQKKSFSTTSKGDVWRAFLMRILLGDKDEVSDAITTIAQPGVGLVAPFDPHYLGWNESRRLLPKFADRLPGPMPANPILFPVGNMFWVRRPIVLAMNEVFGQNYPWPNEPIANDGTEFHLIERLWPAMATHAGLESVFVHKLDEKRT